MLQITKLLLRKRALRFLKELSRPSSSANSTKFKFDTSAFPADKVRNFCIVAHVDHGKSTLADRLLEITGTIPQNGKNEQVLDRLQVEKERGITVKAQTATMLYSRNGETFLLNLIDTPGHVDFSHEVSRSLAACQGVLLVVDANEGIQAQTLANYHLASEAGLKIIPVINKIDLKNANPELVVQQLNEVFSIDPQDIIKISAKLGINCTAVLDAVVARVPAPSGQVKNPLRALIVHSWFDRFRGAILLLAVADGTLAAGDRLSGFQSGKSYDVKEVGLLRPDETPVPRLYAGQVGYVMANIRNTKEACVGDTLFHSGKTVQSLPSFRRAKPMVFAGFFPSDQSELPSLRSAIEKLTMHDASVALNIDSSPALGQGFRLGFLGLLHMDVFQQRLEQEFSASVVCTAPNVPYKIKLKNSKSIHKLYDGEEVTVLNPMQWPDPMHISTCHEPIVLGSIVTPEECIGPIKTLCYERRGVEKEFNNLGSQRVLLRFILPLNEIVIDFYDQLKSISSGFASFDYEDQGYQASNLVKLSILLNGKEVEELTSIVHVSKAVQTGRRLCLRLKEEIPRQQFKVAIQACIGSKILASEALSAVRKDVVGKIMEKNKGGDITRKKKLLERQSEGKKKMRQIGNIQIPKDTFIAVLKK